MGMFEFIVVIVAIGSVSGVIHAALKHEERKQKYRTRGAEGDEVRGLVGDAHTEIARLKDRVRVLEKLVTDDDRRLASEIERLRQDDRLNP